MLSFKFYNSVTIKQIRNTMKSQFQWVVCVKNLRKKKEQQLSYSFFKSLHHTRLRSIPCLHNNDRYL